MQTGGNIGRALLSILPAFDICVAIGPDTSYSLEQGRSKWLLSDEYVLLVG